MAAVDIASVHKHFGSTHVIRGVDVAIADGEFCVLVGPSGCGKSTLLRMIAGLEEISEGEIRIGDRVVNRVPPKERDVAMVFQNYALYPHMTVRDNMSFALMLAKTPKDEIARKVDRAAGILGQKDEEQACHGSLLGLIGTRRRAGARRRSSMSMAARTIRRSGEASVRSAFWKVRAMRARRSVMRWSTSPPCEAAS